jgi:hypothetical protein
LKGPSQRRFFEEAIPEKDLLMKLFQKRFMKEGKISGRGHLREDFWIKSYQRRRLLEEALSEKIYERAISEKVS